jgi:DNA-directed RNA polymerase subunit RPC12/RpoP
MCAYWTGGNVKMVRGPMKILVYLASAVLIFLGIVFIMSTNLGITYFFEGLVFLAVASLLLILSREKKPLEIKQTVTVTGPIKAKEVHCPNCSAIVDPTKTEVVDGKPYVTCKYCGNKFELTEEPTW